MSFKLNNGFSEFNNHYICCCCLVIAINLSFFCGAAWASPYGGNEFDSFLNYWQFLSTVSAISAVTTYYHYKNKHFQEDAFYKKYSLFWLLIILSCSLITITSVFNFYHLPLTAECNYMACLWHQTPFWAFLALTVIFAPANYQNTSDIGITDTVLLLGNLLWITYIAVSILNSAFINLPFFYPTILGIVIGIVILMKIIFSGNDLQQFQRLTLLGISWFLSIVFILYAIYLNGSYILWFLINR